jgi:hypothetical protein
LTDALDTKERSKLLMLGGLECQTCRPASASATASFFQLTLTRALIVSMQYQVITNKSLAVQRIVLLPTWLKRKELLPHQKSAAAALKQTTKSILVKPTLYIL